MREILDTVLGYLLVMTVVFAQMYNPHHAHASLLLICIAAVVLAWKFSR